MGGRRPPCVIAGFAVDSGSHLAELRPVRAPATASRYRCLMLMDEELRQACARYVSGTFAPEDDTLRELRAAIAAEDLPEIYISPDEGRLLQVLLRAVDARRVVEIGSLGGYSAIWMGRALPDGGELITLEIDPRHAELARRFIERAGLGDRVEVRVGDAHELLAPLAEEGPFDAVFIDADKRGYPAYLDWAVENIRRGGLVIGDNALWNGRVVERDAREPDLVAIQEFNRRLAEDPGLVSIIVPTRDGVAVAVVNGV